MLLVLCMAFMVGCGGGGDDSDAQAEAASTPDTEFLMGSWFAKTCTKDGQTVDADDVFGGTFMLYFSDDGKCTMSIDQQRALVDWVMNDDGSVTLSGDNTYEITFPDDSKTTMNANIKGVDTLLEKYEEDE